MTAPLQPVRAYGSSEVARRLGISTSLLRTWISQLNWSVRRNAEGHRVFSESDLSDLLALKAWVEAGEPLRAFRRPGEPPGPEPEPAGSGGSAPPGGAADLRFELRLGYRRMHELASQAEATWGKLEAVLGAQRSAQSETLERLEALRNETTERLALERTRIVQGILKQLLAEGLVRRGAARRVPAPGPWKAYQTPAGRVLELPDFLETDAERELFASVLSALLPDA